MARRRLTAFVASAVLVATAFITSGPVRHAAAAVAQPTISVPDMVVGEGDGTISVPVTLNDAGLSEVKVNYSTAGATAAGGDYTGVSGTLTFAPGETAKTVPVTITNDTDPEGFETFTLGLAAPTNAVIARPIGQIGIVDNDNVVATPALYVRDATVDESAHVATVAVLMGGPAGQASAGTVTVNYATSNVEATSPSDFTNTTGTLTFSPLQTVKNIVVPIVNDGNAEAAERFRVTLSGVSGNATIGDAAATVTIPANDATAIAQPLISVADRIVSEHDNYLDVPITLSAPGLSQIAVNYSTAGATAAGGDYTGVSGTLRLNPGETSAIVRVPLLDPTDPEGFESFTFGVSAASNAAIARPIAQISIVDDDNVVAKPALFVRDATVDETGRFAVVPVLAGGPAGQSSSGTITVNYATANLEAVSGSDFTNTTGTLTFTPLQTVRNIVVPITNDGTNEAAERFKVTLSGVNSNATIGDGTGVVTITANDASAVAQPSISVVDRLVSEHDGYLDAAILLNAPGLSQVTVSYSTAGATAAGGDYTGVSGTVRLNPGETSMVIRIPILDDVTTEPVEYFTFGVSGAINAAIGDGASRVNVVDDDVSGVNLNVTTNWTAQELPRLQQSATYLGQTPQQLQKTGITLIEYLLALSDPRPAPTTDTPPSSTGPTAYTTNWTSADVKQLWDVQAQYGCTPEQAQKLGVLLVNYLLILGGH